MLREIFLRKEKFPISIIYLILETLFMIIALLSLASFKLRNIQRKKISFIYLNTIGDALEQIHYVILKNKSKYQYKIMALDLFPTNNYLKLLLNKDEYFFYDEGIYKFCLKFIKKIFNKNANLTIRYNYIFQLILNNFLSDLKFYNNNYLFDNDLKKIQKKIIYKNKTFIKAFKKHNINFSKIPTRIDKFNLNKKYSFSFDDIENFLKEKEYEILKKYGLKKNNFICLHIRTDLDYDNLRSSYDLKSYLKLVDFITKDRNLKIVLIGKKNEKINFFFKSFDNVIDYRNSEYQSIENDIYLIKNSNFLITQISGPIIYGVLFNIPILVLDAMIFEDFQIYDKILYFPKKIFIKKNSKQLKMKEILNNPMIYNEKYFDKSKFQAVELNKEEKMKALEIFLECFKKNKFELNYESNQKLRNEIDNHFNFFTYQNFNKIYFD